MTEIRTRVLVGPNRRISGTAPAAVSTRRPAARRSVTALPLADALSNSNSASANKPLVSNEID
jgi:hypothetical protein